MRFRALWAHLANELASQPMIVGCEPWPNATFPKRRAHEGVHGPFPPPCLPDLRSRALSVDGTAAATALGSSQPSYDGRFLPPSAPSLLTDPASA
eukprot:6178181-Pleurochrysis_carterae.AAC.3